MTMIMRLLKNGRCLPFFILLLYGCSSGTEKHAVHTVEIRAMQFVPAELTVNRGDTVIWINNDMVAHDVTELKQKIWSSSVMQTGTSWKMVVNKPADYYCSIHVVMRGKLLIK